jgi:hypothetical protein
MMIIDEDMFTNMDRIMLSMLAAKAAEKAEQSMREYDLHSGNGPDIMSTICCIIDDVSFRHHQDFVKIYETCVRPRLAVDRFMFDFRAMHDWEYSCAKKMVEDEVSLFWLTKLAACIDTPACYVRRIIENAVDKQIHQSFKEFRLSEISEAGGGYEV